MDWPRPYCGADGWLGLVLDPVWSGPWGALVAIRGIDTIMAAVAGGSTTVGRAYLDLLWIWACGMGVAALQQAIWCTRC